MIIRTKRIHVGQSHDNGFRILVDRLWPTGISESEAKVDLVERDCF